MARAFAVFVALACSPVLVGVGCSDASDADSVASHSDAWRRARRDHYWRLRDAGAPDGAVDGASTPSAPAPDAAAPVPDAGSVSVTDCTNVPCHYVRSGAGAGGDGSDWTRAFSSLPATLVRGHVYFVADGTYPSYTFATPAIGATPITVKKATPADHGSSAGWTASYGDGQAVFTGMLDFTSSHWLLDGQTGGGAANGWSGGFGFKVSETSDANAVLRVAHTGTADDVTIRHVEAQGKGSVSTQGGSYSNDGLAIYGAKNVTLSHFWMHGIGRGPFFVSAENATFEHGWVESYFGSSDVHSEIASIWSFDGVVGDMTFRHNLFTDVQSTGGLMWDNSANQSAHLYVYGNVFFKPTGATWGVANGLIGGWTGGHGEECRNLVVYANTFVNVDQAALSTLPRVHSGNVAFDNLFYASQSPDFSIFDAHDGNEFVNAGDAHGEANGVSVSSGVSFRNVAAMDFRLVNATPAGIALPAPFDVDAFGLTRGADGTWDRGAFEVRP